MSTLSEDLIARLRIGFDVDLSESLLFEAADRIEQLEARVRELSELLKVSSCPQNCDNGAVPNGPFPDGSWEATQCQFCYERDTILNAIND